MTAFPTTISGLKSYQQRFESLSRNLAAAGAVAGKAEETFITSFKLSPGNIAGVQSSSLRCLDAVGASIESDVGTHFDIRGQGHACVSSSPTSPINFSRDGTFKPNEAGYLVNQTGQYLQGFLTHPNGTLLSSGASLKDLKPININDLRLQPQSTTTLTTSANFNPNGNNFSYDVVAYTPFGTQETLTFNWTKCPTDTDLLTPDTEQAWTLNISGSSSAVGGAYGTAGLRVEMDAGGAPLGYVDLSASSLSSSPNIPTIPITWKNIFTTAQPIQSSLTLELNNITSSSPISQGYAESDGYGSGVFQSLTFDKNGYGKVKYSNQREQCYCRVPLAIFNNTNGLNEVQPGVFAESTDSGPYILGFPNTDAFGSLQGGYWEGSTVDTLESYLDMIENQQDYILLLKVVEVLKAMLAKLENV